MQGLTRAHTRLCIWWHRLGGPQLQRPASSRLAASSPDIDSLLDGLDVPDIEADLADFQAQAGAVFDDAGVAVSFGNDRAAFEAWQQGTVVVDRSHWGRLRLSGPDRQSFLHGQSTADINALQPGSGGDTVLVTPQVSQRSALYEGQSQSQITLYIPHREGNCGQHNRLAWGTHQPCQGEAMQTHPEGPDVYVGS